MNVANLYEQDWDDIISRLTVYATRLVQANTWLRSRRGLATGGMNGEDYAMRAIGKVFKGASSGRSRVWDPNKGALLPFLMGVVKSDVSTDVKSVENTSRHVSVELAETRFDDAYFEVVECFKDNPNVAKVVEMCLDNATDEQIKAALPIKRAEFERIRKCLREHFGLPPDERRLRDGE